MQALNHTGTISWRITLPENPLASVVISVLVVISLALTVVAMRQRRSRYACASGLLLCIAGTIAQLVWNPGLPLGLIRINAVCLSVCVIAWTLLGISNTSGVPQFSIGPRTVAVAHVAMVLSMGLLLVFVTYTVAVGVTSSSLLTLRSFDLFALATIGGAVVIGFWDEAWRYPMAALYSFAFAAVVMAQTWRGFSPGRFFIWGMASDLAGFVLITALVGWGLQRFISTRTMLHIPNTCGRWPVGWFLHSQAVLGSAAAALTAWVSIDFSFDGTGNEVALFGLSGRSAGCTAALMLLGASILMAWQTTGRWRAGWQSAAMMAGLLFTSSMGWAQIDAATAFSEEPTPWLQRSTNLLISATMMTVMTRFGLARVLPQSDWIPRARSVSPVFAGLALLMLAFVLYQRI